jgi:DNA-binding NtrC family response regulator
MKWVSFIPSNLRRIVIRAAQLDHEPVYLSGETGSGKSAIARWIHQNSPRSAKPFVTYQAGDSLTEKIAEAEEGTLVLSDLDRLHPAERTRLTKLIQSKSFVDPSRPGVRVLVRARIIATGNGPIDEFSAFDRVFKDFRVHLPSLHERQAELEDIVTSLLEEMAHELRRDHVRGLSKEAMASLKNHVWRANLRELRNILRYGVLRTKSSTIEAAHLPDLSDPYGILVRNREGFAEIERSLAGQTSS